MVNKAEGMRPTIPPGAREFYQGREATFRQPSARVPRERMPKELEQGPEEGVRAFQGHSREEYGKQLEVIHSTEARAVFEKACQICEAVKHAGGRALLVGGAVRDEVLGMPSKDFDIEVYGLQPEEVEQIVATFGNVKDVGKAFGILKLGEGGTEIDVSLPRTDSKIGEGHTGFEVKVDPAMSIREAAKRRDFTFNALSKDPLTGEIFDPFGGIEDLRTRTMRVTDPERFQDDPLRLLRAAQFAGRFGMAIDPKSMELMREMAPALREISKDRVREEWEKLLVRSERPSMGLNTLHSLGIIDAYYPELATLKGTEQEFEWHPEGDVWIHTLLVLDAARDVVRKEKLEGDTARVVMLGALCHDLGKPSTTTYDADGRIRSHAHDVEGVEPSLAFLERIGARRSDMDKIAKLTKEHIWPGTMYLAEQRGESVSDGAFRRVARRLHPATLAELTYVAEADRNGMGPYLDPENPHQLLIPDGFPAGQWVRKRAEEVGVYTEKPKPLIMGRDLIALGFAPGKVFGDIIKLSDDCRDLRGMAREDVVRILLACGGNAKNAIERLRERLGNEIEK